MRVGGGVDFQLGGHIQVQAELDQFRRINFQAGHAPELRIALAGNDQDEPGGGCGDGSQVNDPD